MAPTSLHMLSVFSGVTPPLLDHPRTSLRWVNQWLPADVEFGRTELVDPNHNGQLALDDTVVDTLCRSLDVVLDPAKDVGSGSIPKEDDGLFITLPWLAELFNHTVEVLLVGAKGTETIVTNLALTVEVPQIIPVFVDVVDIFTIEC